ncbi:MAG: hypothetical protein JWO43_444 [Candidatus Adlerbacteria bacterium]|nr:hypothetical protein [Candidatus Adlerbacteria bacterium]
MMQTCALRLAEMAHRALHIKGLRRDQVVMVCIKVDSRWRWIVDQLMPGADWQQYRDQGQEPVARGSAMWPICEAVADELPDLKDALLEIPAEGRVKVIALDDGGGTVYEIIPKPEGKTQ